MNEKYKEDSEIKEVLEPFNMNVNNILEKKKPDLGLNPHPDITFEIFIKAYKV